MMNGNRIIWCCRYFLGYHEYLYQNMATVIIRYSINFLNIYFLLFIIICHCFHNIKKVKNYNTHKKQLQLYGVVTEIYIKATNNNQPNYSFLFLSHSPSKINTFRIKFVLIMFQIKIICVYLSQIVFSLKFLNKSFNNFDHTQYFHCFVWLGFGSEKKNKKLNIIMK